MQRQKGAADPAWDASGPLPLTFCTSPAISVHGVVRQAAFELRAKVYQSLAFVT